MNHTFKPALFPCEMGKARFAHTLSKAGFTLIELLVALAIIAVLAVLAMTTGKSAVAFSAQTKCAGNLRNLGVATAAYVGEHNGFLPLTHESNMDSQVSSYGGNETGTWYWELAPYVGVPRWDSLKSRLGEDKKSIPKPIVFTCPSHGKTESSPIIFPSSIPVSYAPSTRIVKVPTTPQSEAIRITRISLKDVAVPSKKIWLSDSAKPDIQNISAARWPADVAWETAWPRQGFTRHSGAGNALFYDGHVERVPYEKIISGTLATNLANLFDSTVSY